MEDTHYIDREQFRLTGERSLGPLEGPFWLLWAATLGIAAGVLAAWIGQDGRQRRREVTAPVARRMPILARGISREMFGCQFRSFFAQRCQSMRGKYNLLKRRALSVFENRGWLSPPSWAIPASFYPIRTSYSYLLRLYRWKLLDRTLDRLAWLRRHRLDGGN